MVLTIGGNSSGWDMRRTAGVMCAALLAGCATTPRPMSTALIVPGDYQAVAQCLHSKIRGVAPWHLYEISEQRFEIRLGIAPGDVSRIELHDRFPDQTEARFFIPHPDSYIIQLLACSESQAG